MIPYRRLIDPREQLVRVGDESLGAITTGELRRRTDQTIKQDADPQRNQLIIVQETLVWHRANLTASTTLALLYPIPTASATFDSLGRSLRIPEQARLLFSRLTANADVTAGTVTPQLQITEGADVSTVLLEEAQLDTTNPNSNAVKFDWEVAPQIAAGATIQMQIVGSGTLTPATLDFTGVAVLGYATWI